MSDIFVSYKREDEARVAQLVRVLEGAGHAVWWDRALPGAEGWRENITAALAAARVVVVCWTRESIGPEGKFVQDEASRAGPRLVQVLLDRGIAPPLGFGADQALDLSYWRSGANNPFSQDLLALVRAKLNGKPAPKPKGPASRAFKRFVYGGGLTAFALGLLAFAWATPVVRETTCALPVPGLARTCCEAGFTEKIADVDEAWTPATREAPMTLSLSAPAFPSEADARADAQLRLILDARQICTITNSQTKRLAGAEAREPRIDCTEIAGRWRCMADYIAHCQTEERLTVARCPR